MDEWNGQGFLTALEEHPELELHALLVLRSGAPVLEQYAEPYRRSDRPLVYSASKTFAATAVGLAVGEGRFGLDDCIVDLLADRSAEPAGTAVPTGSTSREVDDRVAEITVHHLLSMSTGHTEDTIETMTARPPEQWVEAFLAIRPQQPVGSCHVYNNGASFLLGELVRRHTGKDLLDYLRPRVLEPLGIEATWDTDAAGRCLGWTGLHVDARGLAAMGELLRCDGVWRGRRLLPEGWVARATSKQIPTVDDSPEWNLGYGYQVWMGREGYRLDGAYGQFAFVLPERELVVAVQSAQSCTQVLIDLLWGHLPSARSVEPAQAPAPTLRPAHRRPGSTIRMATVPILSDSGRGTTWTHTGPVPLDATMVDEGE
ncbi:MAG: serine hydrolase, partial [Propionibacteriaceae bacterium]|nr:serine hydrolase [Propionibacteriaceae bacterium]